MVKRKISYAQIFFVSLIIIWILAALAQYIYIEKYNAKVYTTEGLDKKAEAYIDLHNRGDDTSTWYKDDLDLYGTTYDGTIYNNSKDDINSWKMVIYIQEDCYINQFWNGEVEIHQYVGTNREVVERLSLASCDREKTKLEYVEESSDLLIPLRKGDQVIYYPSKDFKEDEVRGGDNIVIGGIFYYRDDLDLTHYQIDYKRHMNYTEGIGFLIIIGIAIICMVLLGAILASNYTYKKAKKEMEIRKTSISCMSEIYSVIFIVDILRNRLLSINVDPRMKNFMLDDSEDAETCLQKAIAEEVSDRYKDIMNRFCQIDSVIERLKNRNSIVCEYISKNFGWCRARFISMERDETGKVERVLFAIQEIDEERAELDKIKSHMYQVESESRERSIFLAGISKEIREPIDILMHFNSNILESTKEENTKKNALAIKQLGKLQLFIVDNILDYFKLEKDQLELVNDTYSLKAMLLDIYDTTLLRLMGGKVDFSIDVQESIPDKLYGDVKRLKQVIISLLANAVSITKEGKIEIIVYGKEVADQKIHLMISVKNIVVSSEYKDFLEGKKSGVHKKINFDEAGIGINLTKLLLVKLNSELKVANIYEDSNSFYFELEQKIMDPTPVGKLNIPRSKD